MTTQKKRTLLALTLALMLLLGGCGAAGTTLTFSFHTDEPADSYDERTFSLTEDIAQVKLEIDLKIDEGEVTLRLDDAATGDWLWRGAYDTSQTVVIELENLRMDGEYRLSAQATQARNVDVSIKTRVLLEEGG